jgi:hypothetical protein
MIIRDAVEADLTEIVAIYNAAIRGRISTAQLEEVSVEQRLPWFRKHSAGRHPLWIAERDGRIAGWLSFQPFKKRSGLRRNGGDQRLRARAVPPSSRRTDPCREGDRASAQPEAERAGGMHFRSQCCEFAPVRTSRLRPLGISAPGRPSGRHRTRFGDRGATGLARASVRALNPGV